MGNSNSRVESLNKELDINKLKLIILEIINELENSDSSTLIENTQAKIEKITSELKKISDEKSRIHAENSIEQDDFLQQWW